MIHHPLKLLLRGGDIAVIGRIAGGDKSRDRTVDRGAVLIDQAVGNRLDVLAVLIVHSRFKRHIGNRSLGGLAVVPPLPAVIAGDADAGERDDDQNGRAPLFPPALQVVDRLLFLEVVCHVKGPSFRVLKVR